MMNGAHSATGLLAGVGIAAAAHATPAALALSALVGAGAALAPDIDHDQSTVTKSSGPITRGVAELLQALSRGTYRATRLPHDPEATGKRGEHRGLIHAPAFALLVGALIAAGTVWSPWVAIVASYVLTSAAVRSLRWSLPGGLRKRMALGAPLMPPLVTLAITYALVQAGALDEVGPWLGMIVALGMIVHSAGDGATNTGISFWWPFKRRCDQCRDHDRADCPGARWDKQNTLPKMLRWSAGARREVLIRLGCLALAGWIAWPILAASLPTGATS